MPSRQMAFQMGELEYKECLRAIVSRYDLRDPKVALGDWIDSFEPDPKKRGRLRAAILIAVACQKEGVDPMAVRKLVCWRDEKGEPGRIEAEVFGGRLETGGRV